MHEKIHRAPLLLDLLEHRVDRGDILDVAWHHERRTGLLGERLHALGKRVALIGEGELCAMVRKRFGDTPGDRVVVGDPHDQPALPVHQPRHNNSCSITLTFERSRVLKVTAVFHCSLVITHPAA